MNGRSDGPVDADEKRWRRRSLYALIVLLPLLIGVSAYESISAWWVSRDRLAQDVELNGSGDFGGSQWKLSKFRMLPVPAGKDIPEGAMGMLAEFEVQVQDADLAKNWRGCTISLESPDGRRWAPTEAMRLPRSEARPCTTTIYMSGAKAGSTVRVREAFLAPRDVADSLRVAVTLQPQQPRYLRFAQPPQLIQVKPPDNQK
ncbi:hypothetical protein [Bordetella muralis]|uniref:hypothetical protein n=1 Tax=Bordetella muralis TaxID=1649130 RepID=UPI0039EEC811